MKAARNPLALVMIGFLSGSAICVHGDFADLRPARRFLGAFGRCYRPREYQRSGHRQTLISERGRRPAGFNGFGRDGLPDVSLIVPSVDNPDLPTPSARRTALVCYRHIGLTNDGQNICGSPSSAPAISA
jgi:hypothetical protein